MARPPQPESPRSDPEVLPPGSSPSGGRLGSGSGLFRDENLDLLSRVLDTWFRIPGTSIRFGLDGIIGLVPGIGDVLAGLASTIIIIAAWVRGAPYVTIARMLVNLGLDVIIGAIPFVGDAFDIAWKANRRNYALLTRHLEQPRRHHWGDWLFLGGVALVVCIIFAVPVLIIAWLLHVLFTTSAVR
jgi:NAD/NADP transhydrogenase beta subunit